MTFQAVRRYFEEPVETALTAAGIPIRYENQLVPDSGADLEFALIRLNFGTTTETTFCEPLENLRGALTVDVYLEKGYGPSRAQTVATDIMRSLVALNVRPKAPVNNVLGQVGQLDGPSFTALADQPYFVVRLSCGVVASVKTP